MEALVTHLFICSLVSFTLYCATCEAHEVVALDESTEVSTTSAQAELLGPRQPNFVFIISDDQRYDALGITLREQGAAARFPFFRNGTPNIDRLARQGIRFKNAFVSQPLCSPSRAAFFTGRYNHLNGVVNNHTDFPVGSVTHASVLRGNGYRTGYFGKWHMSRQTARPGFTETASYSGQGNYQDAAFLVNGKWTPTTGWVDDVTTDYAITFIQANAARKFSIVVGFKSPHSPRTPPARWSTQYANATPTVPPSALAAPPFGGNPTTPLTINANNFRNYFRCISAIDENVGRIMATLDAAGIADDTVVVYASDNGYFFGEHHRGDKRLAYDEAIRIPLIVRYPRLPNPGRSIDLLVMNIDLFPTMVELASLAMAMPAGIQGRSWHPILTQNVSTWRGTTFHEYFYEAPGGGGVPTWTSIRTPTATRVEYLDHPEWLEVYQLTNDPFQVNNLAANPDYTALRGALQTNHDGKKASFNYVVPAYADPQP